MSEGALSRCVRQITGVKTILFAKPSHVCALLLLALCSACLDSGRSLDWADPDAIPLAARTMADDSARSEALLELLRTMPQSEDSLADPVALPVIQMPPAPNTALGDGVEPLDAARCAQSLRVHRTTRGDVAVWWSARSGGRVHLLTAWRDAGQRTWRGPIPVDTLDQGSTDARDVAEGGAVGCQRPAAGLSVDDVNGYVHVSYALVGPEGPGIFYAHQMDPRAAFEPPIPIVYGERLGAARVGSDGDLVAVVYEDPNSGARQRIALAVSRAAGHVFEGRLNVNAGLNPAANPFVHVMGRAIVVGWHEAPPAGGDTTFLYRRAVAR